MKAVLVVLLLAGAALLAGCAKSPPVGSPDRIIDITLGRYFFDPGTNHSLNATKGESLLLRLHTLDVTHGFAITEYGIQEQVAPGGVTQVRIVADKIGDFVIYCTVFCGTGHPQHKGTFHVSQ